jgi:hypothetical protein
VKREYVLSRIKHLKLPRVSFTTYNRRDMALSKDGFLWWERFWLSQHAVNSPTLKRVRTARIALRNQFKQDNKSWTDYVHFIKDMYAKNGWIFNNGSFNPFKMVDWWRIQGVPLPDTPQPKRPKIARDYKSVNKRNKNDYRNKI